MQAVLLAAGKGTRLRPLTRTTPKALIDICGKPLLQHILEALPDAVQEIFIIVGYLRGQVMERFGGTWDGKPIRYIVQDPLTGTGPAVHLAKDRLRGKFLVVNGDDIYSRHPRPADGGTGGFRRACRRTRPICRPGGRRAETGNETPRLRRVRP